MSLREQQLKRARARLHTLHGMVGSAKRDLYALPTSLGLDQSLLRLLPENDPYNTLEQSTRFGYRIGRAISELENTDLDALLVGEITNQTLIDSGVVCNACHDSARHATQAAGQLEESRQEMLYRAVADYDLLEPVG